MDLKEFGQLVSPPLFFFGLRKLVDRDPKALLPLHLGLETVLWGEGRATEDQVKQGKALEWAYYDRDGWLTLPRDKTRERTVEFGDEARFVVGHFAKAIKKLCVEGFLSGDYLDSLEAVDRDGLVMFAVLGFLDKATQLGWVDKTDVPIMRYHPTPQLCKGYAEWWEQSTTRGTIGFKK